LKLKFEGTYGECEKVAPRRGAWIETEHFIDDKYDYKVAPRRGAWIETGFARAIRAFVFVAPRRGAWIETLLHYIVIVTWLCRAPQGRVD